MAIVHDSVDRKGSEFFFNAWDNETGTGYTLDLDLETLLGDWIGADPIVSQDGAATLAAAVVGTDQYDSNGVLFNGRLTEFASTFSNTADVQWTLVAYDVDGRERSIVTADANIASPESTALTNQQAELLAGTLDNQATQVNAFAATEDADTYHTTTDSNGAAYAGNFGETYQGNVFDTSNVLGATSNLYVVTPDSLAASAQNDAASIGQISTAGDVGITARTYEINGEWYLEVKAEGATDGTKDTVVVEPEPFNSAKPQSEIDSFAQIGADKYVVVYSDGSFEKFTGDDVTFTDGATTAAQLGSTNPSANAWAGGFTPTVFESPGNPALAELLDLQLIGTDGNENVISTVNVGGQEVDLGTNDFMNLGAGDDAAQGGAGNDTLDGGLGSNFLTGGTGGDTFFIDGRGAFDIPDGVENDAEFSTWSTIVDFSAADGDTINLWGWEDGVSQLLLTRVAGEGASGATGFEGFTHHYDLNGNGNIDTSITFTGLDAVPPTNEAREVAGLGYQFYGA